MARSKKLNLGMSSIKRFLFILITTLFLIGVFVTAIGSSFHAVYSEFEVFIDTDYFKPVVFFILVGVFILMASVIGFIGVVKTSTLVVNLFAGALAILLILEIATSILGFTFSSSIYGNVKSNMNSTLKQYNKCYAAEKSWDCIQSRLFCCGINDAGDWASEGVNGTLIAYENSTFTVPESCCGNSKCTKIYKRGCIHVLGDYASDAIVTVTCLVTIVLILQVFGVILSSALARAIRPAKTQREIQRQENVRKIREEVDKEYAAKSFSPVLFIPASSTA